MRRAREYAYAYACNLKYILLWFEIVYGVEWCEMAKQRIKIEQSDAVEVQVPS